MEYSLWDSLFKLHRRCLSRNRNIYLRLANKIRFTVGNIVESVMQYDAVNARCTDVGQQNSCKILADDAKSLIELYRSNPTRQQRNEI